MFKFIHPVSHERFTVESLIEIQSILIPHLLTSQDLCRMMKTNSLSETEAQFAFQAILHNDYGFGAQLCARIHSMCLKILNDAEKYFETSHIEVYKE